MPDQNTTHDNRPARRWRRTDLVRADGSLPPDDWRLTDPTLGAITRIYRPTGGPQGGRWFWAVQVDAKGRPWNGGTGYAPTGAEAKAAFEAILADF
jgi:hypothetical protein